MTDYRSLEQKIRDVMIAENNRNTEIRRKMSNVGRPTDNVKDETSKLAKQGEIKTKIIDEDKDWEKDSAAVKASKDKKFVSKMIDKWGQRGGAWLNHPTLAPKPKEKTIKEDGNIIDEAAPDQQTDGSFMKDKDKDTKKKSDAQDEDDPREIKGGKTEVDLKPTTDDSTEDSTKEDETSKNARKKVNKEIGAKGVKEHNMTGLNFGLPQGLIDTVRNVVEAKIDEKLVGNQHKIDANKNNKIDAHDFKLLKSKKKMKEEAEDVKESIISNLERGAKINHPKHGKGTTKGYSGPGLYTVKYDSGKEKQHREAELKKYHVSKANEETDPGFSEAELARLEEIANKHND